MIQQLILGGCTEFARTRLQKQKKLVTLVPALLRLDWRDVPSKKVIIERILMLFNNLDTYKQISVRLESSLIENVVFLAEKDGVEAFRCMNKIIRWKVNTIELCRYWTDLFVVAEILIVMQMDEQALKGRFIAYKDVSLKHRMPQESTMVFFLNGIDGLTARAEVQRDIWRAIEMARVRLMVGVIERIERIKSSYDLIISISIRELNTRLFQGWYYVMNNASRWRTMMHNIWPERQDLKFRFIGISTRITSSHDNQLLGKFVYQQRYLNLILYSIFISWYPPYLFVGYRSNCLSFTFNRDNLPAWICLRFTLDSTSFWRY